MTMFLEGFAAGIASVLALSLAVLWLLVRWSTGAERHSPAARRSEFRRFERPG